MLSKEMMESLRGRMYSRCLNIANQSAIGREERYKSFIAEAWDLLMSEVGDENDRSSDNPCQAGTLVMILNELGLLKSQKKTSASSPLIYEIALNNWSYEIHQGLKGVLICPVCGYYSMDVAKKMLFGVTPSTEQPYYFLARVLNAFDSSVPGLLEVAREEEYKAMQALKRHDIRIATIDAVLSELKSEYVGVQYSCLGEKTECRIFTDDYSAVITIFSDENLEQRMETLKREVHDILLNPWARIKKYEPLYTFLCK